MRENGSLDVSISLLVMLKGTLKHQVVTNASHCTAPTFLL